MPKNIIMFQAIFLMHLEKTKSEGGAGLYNEVARDDEHPVIKFKGKRDNGTSKLHAARFTWLPISDPSKWFHKVAAKRKPVIRTMPLEASGTNDQVSTKSVEAMHDRTRVLKLKFFHSGKKILVFNYNEYV